MAKPERYYRVFEASPVPTLILSGEFPHLFIKEANAAYLSLTGGVRENIIDTPVALKSTSDGRNHDKPVVTVENHSIEKVYLEKVAVKAEPQKILHPSAGSEDDITLFYEATNTPVLTEDGEVDFVIHTLQNVTDFVHELENRKEKDLQLSEIEWVLKETQKVAKIGKWEMDKNNRFTWSDIHYDIMEVERGTDITVDFGVELLKTKEDRDAFEGLYRKAVESGEYFNVDLHIITPKGNERVIRYTGKGELKNGEFLKMYGIGQDVTEQVKTEQQLRYSRDQMEALIQTVDGVVFESDARTLEFIFVSEQIFDLLGYTPEECIQQRGFVEKLLHPEDKDEIIERSFNQVQTKKNYSGDYRVVRKDGVVIWVNVSISVISENGSPKWLRGLMIDITASKRVSELERIEKNVLELSASPSESTVNVLKAYIQGLESIYPEMICSIMRVNRGRLYNWASNSLPLAYNAAIEKLPIADNTGSCGTAAFINQRVIVSDIANDPRWARYKDIALNHNLRSCWSQPIVNASRQVIASLGMYYRTVKSPTDEEQRVIDRTTYLLQVILQDRHNRELLEEANFLMEQSQELAKFGSVQLDVETRELTWSSILYDIFGLSKEIKPTIDLYYEALHPDDKEKVIAKIQNFLKTKEDYVSEERIIRPNGEVRNLRTWGRVRSNEKGDPVKVIAAYMDITESKEIEEKLLASESRLRSLVDSQTNYVIRVDFKEHYTYANNKYIEDFGPATGETIIGTDAMDSVVPSQRHKVEEVCQKCIAHPHEVFELEIEKYDNKGEVKYTFWHFICLTDSKDSPVEIQCIGLDVSDRKKAEDEREKQAIELLESEKRYSDLFHLSPQPMWVYDPDTLQFLDVNNAAIQQYGYPRNQFLSMSMRDIKPLQRLPELDDINRKKQQAFFGGTVTHKLRSGDLIQVDVKRNMIPYKGKMAHLVLASNVTERIDYLRALEIQNERLKEIAWIQLHVVRAPLARIMELVDILENYNPEEVDRSMLLKSIVSSAYELDAVIKDIVRKTEQIQIS